MPMIGECSFKNKEISLYFHIPFCTKKCSYCHFFVLPDVKSNHRQLIDAILLDLLGWQEQLRGQKLISLYFGGGTPSLLGPSELGEILKYVQRIIPFNPTDIEITLEANPETIDQDKLMAFADIGINRLSIGVQTLDDQLLKKLGRTHTASASLASIETAYRSGFENISIDLMYDLPCQTLSSWGNTLKYVGDLPITHLSLYNLTIEPNTVFFKYQEVLRKELPDAESSAAMYLLAQEMLNKFGLLQYEISAFAKEDLFSKHNVGYWTGRPFLGFGPSAFSYWEKSRFRLVPNLKVYAEKLKNGESSIDFKETLEAEPAKRELLTLALRLKKGVELNSFEKTHGPLALETHMSLQRLIRDDLLVNESNTIKLSSRGILFYDTVATELI